MKLYLQDIVENLSLEKLPAEWQGVDFARFSKNKILFDYQQESLKNALKALYLYFEEYKEDKSKFFKHYQNNGLFEKLDYNIKESKTIKYLKDYDKDYPIKDEKISFEWFINRMSFWMATGSGKTLVIVKLLEILGYLIKNKKIPEKEILFLTYREDLIEQFKKHIDEFNSYGNEIRINLINLKDYESSKFNQGFKFPNVVDVYYYRSDLISDEQKDKIINFKNYDNNGNWYILLDEAHKGDKEDSKRQIFYSILSRNGFLFNFSATFTDERDYATCVYNFNLSQFVEKGYGKHIYISKQSIKELENKVEVLENEKQKILLKILILQTALNIQYKKIKKINENLYHKPLLLTLVNSVNTDDSDLELFFKELEKIGNYKDKNNYSILIDNSKDEIIKELLSENSLLEFEESKVNQKITDVIKNVTLNDILKYVYNSDKPGKIEVLKIPSNKQELIFKLTTSERPFALMKIGDITKWIKTKLTGYEINEKFDNESFFSNINENDDINILMGSRSFYEGWDSNRPNVLLFINIGKGSDARKFVLQSVGRGVRIEVLPNKRKRMKFLYNNKEVDKGIFDLIKDDIEPLETLFVFGTKAENLKEVIDTLKQEKTDEIIGNLFEINPDIKNKELLIPKYKNSAKLIVEEKEVVKFLIHPDDYETAKNYFNYIRDKIALLKFDCDIRVLSEIKNGFNGGKNKFFNLTKEEAKINNPELILKRIFAHFKNKIEEFDSFKELEKEIIHFEKISVNDIKIDDLKEKINLVKKVKNKESKKDELKRKLKEGIISVEDYTTQIEDIAKISEVQDISLGNEKLKVKYIQNHYYLPLIMAEQEKIDFIKHIIKHKSEINFINELDNYLKNKNNFFTKFDWWFFSKVDETLDEVYIPYYNPKTNKIDKFKPDFIFWLKKDNNYTILFVDPKGTEHTDAYRKIDGFKRIFTKDKYTHNNLNINVRLLLYTSDISKVEDNYKDFWIDKIDSLEKILN
jgi:superfamily II DNA or RNA helicase